MAHRHEQQTTSVILSGFSSALPDWAGKWPTTALPQRRRVSSCGVSAREWAASGLPTAHVPCHARDAAGAKLKVRTCRPKPMSKGRPSLVGCFLQAWIVREHSGCHVAERPWLQMTLHWIWARKGLCVCLLSSLIALVPRRSEDIRVPRRMGSSHLCRVRRQFGLGCPFADCSACRTLCRRHLRHAGVLPGLP